jgi:superfamily II DNA helicase RecQ
MIKAHQLLKDIFGYHEFRGAQSAIIEHILGAAMRWC